MLNTDYEKNVNLIFLKILNYTNYKNIKLTNILLEHSN